MIVVPVAVIAATAVTVLLLFVGGSTPSDRIELIKTGLTVGAGTGGMVALVLNGRRQTTTEHDASERRLTDLYLKAVEQLGSDKAAIRHGGCFALERVAQDNPGQRQTVVNVLCAYLRTPYTEPAPTKTGVRRPLVANRRLGLRLPPPGVDRLAGEVRQERGVRLTVQRILTQHLNPGTDPRHPDITFWPGIDLDLTGATLVEFSLLGCRVREAIFAGATFLDDAWFDFTTFTDVATFEGATFTSDARFNHAVFGSAAWFLDTTFAANAGFNGTEFLGGTMFTRSMFAKNAAFDGAIFAEDREIDGASFARSPTFEDAEFRGR
ncbi:MULTISPECIES: pentapeptide repeat-containing protein [Amycolatopsis]|uniref:Pentapeptide repeat-containing protein n=1 Tax=Amycolatopsis dendrobii TaxID=2760662 RepID=A0A7W3VZM4_9PSEU|nr:MULTISPECIES: pentapeptide repeat-containing protein [Amycolatopsis]MBB1155662.1 pentapeptide repeat-containing protein [Amycolatopsis dendrobii]UKD52871.1 pentapeptide repeat-containing protein [Amycolatopsis sp. FU40]